MRITPSTTPIVPRLSRSPAQLCTLAELVVGIVAEDDPIQDIRLQNLFTEHDIHQSFQQGQLVTELLQLSPIAHSFDPAKLKRLKAQLDATSVKPELLTDQEELIGARETIDYDSIIGDHRIVYLGEFHHSETIMQEVMALMPRLRDRGFTHFAMEMFHSASQNKLDEYAQRYDNNLWAYPTLVEKEIDAAVFTTTYDKRMHCDSEECAKKLQPIYDNYFRVVIATIKSGLHTVGIEWCRWDGRSLTYHQHNYWNRMGLTPAVLEEIRKPGSRRSEIHNDLYDNLLPIRNWHGAKVLANILENPKARVAVLGGVKHYGYHYNIRNNFTLNHLVGQRAGVSGPVIYFATPHGEDRNGRYVDSPSLPRLVVSAANALSVDDQRFMIRTEPRPDMDMPDVVIHLPAKAL
jgi:hypothetical protein